MYFVRLQIAHVFEGLKVISKLNSHEELRAKVEQCDEQTQAAFKRLVAVIGTNEYQDDEAGSKRDHVPLRDRSYSAGARALDQFAS